MVGDGGTAAVTRRRPAGRSGPATRDAVVRLRRDVLARSRPPSRATGLPALVARTVAIDGPGAAARRCCPACAATDVVSWVRRGDGLVGWGAALRLRRRGPDRFAEAQRPGGASWSAHAVVRDEVGLPGTGPVAFGSFAFAADSPGGGALVVPEVVVGRRGRTGGG